GDGLGQGDQVGGAADALELAAAFQAGSDGDRVGGLAAAVEVEDGVVDGLVRGAVEVAGAQHLDHVGDGVLAEQHAAEHGLFCGQVVGRLTAEVLAGGLGREIATVPAVIGGRHLLDVLSPRRSGQSHDRVRRLWMTVFYSPAPTVSRSCGTRVAWRLSNPGAQGRSTASDRDSVGDDVWTLTTRHADAKYSCGQTCG